MKISLEWLKEHVDLEGISDEEIAHRLTMATAEVEGVEELSRCLDGVVVGEVLSAEPLGDDGLVGQRDQEPAKLHLARVDAGGRELTTVCGAPNVRPGLKAAFAAPGVTLADGTTIAARALAGQRSEGVLCSPRELGLSEFHEALLEVPAGLASGAPLGDLIPARDLIIEVDNKSLTHRPDLWGHHGFARELAALYGRELRPLAQVDLSCFDELPAFPVAIDDLDGCPCYTCLQLSAPGDLPSPLLLQARLHALGQRTFGLLVDLTNYIMLELGQPTHAFDGDKLAAVRVAPMGDAGDSFTTLDGQRRRMLPDDLMIWNEREPVAIAGVMGGLDSEVTPATTRLLLESANFRGSRVRRTSVRLGLRSDASLRFEKDQPPVNARAAVGRFLHLMEQAGAAPRVSSRLSMEGDLRDRMRPLVVSERFLQARFGMEIPRETSLGILRSLGFTASAEPGQDEVRLGIPPHRSEKDVSIREDIVEEVLRIYGYDNITPRMPEVSSKPVWINADLRREHKARRLLAQAHGFGEVHSYSWFDDTWLATLGHEPTGTLRLKNPSARHLARMRTTLVPNLLAMVRPNSVHQEAFRLFELGHAYAARGGDAEERQVLAGVSHSQARDLRAEEHFRGIRGALEDLALALSLDHTLSFTPQPEAGDVPWQQAGCWLSIRCGEQEVGSAGLLAGELLEKVTHNKGQVVWFELEMGALVGPVYPEGLYRPASPYPGSWHDFSLVWETARGFAALQDLLDRFDSPLVQRRELLYLYQGKGLDKGQGSYTFRYWLGAQDHTLSGEEIEGFRGAFLAFLEAQGLTLR